MADVAMRQRLFIVELRSRGFGPMHIWREYGIAPSQSKKWWGRWTSGQGLEDLPRTGSPGNITKATKQKLRALLKRKKRGSTRAAANDYYKDTGERVSHMTVWRVGTSLGLKHRIRRKKPRLRPANKERRLAFARQERPALVWRRVVSTDEKTYTLQFDSRGQWVELNEEPEPRGTVKYDTSVRVWGGVCYRGLTALRRIPKSMTGIEYQHFLEHVVYPDLREKFGEDFIFQHDGDGSHTAAVVVNWLDQQPEEWIRDWPAQSPDLAPIENLWAILLRRLEGRRVRTADGLWRALKEEWENIGQEIWRNLGASFPNRMALVIAANGGPIKY